MKKVKICLVDDHKLFRSGIKEMLINLQQFDVIFEADNGEDFFAKIGSKLMPDIVLLDINMPKINGFEVAQRLQTQYPMVKIIVLSMLTDADAILKMVKLGIAGFVLKDAKKEEFVNALNTVLSGDVYFATAVNKVLHCNIKKTQLNEPLITDRDLVFLKCLCAQQSYQDIATQMGVSVRTVEGYRDQLFEKLNIRNKIGLVIYAIKNKLVSI